MSEVVKLGVVPISNAKEQLMERFEADVVKMREWLQDTKSGGYALLAYDRCHEDGRLVVHSWVNYFVTDPGDCFWLPDMAKTRIYQRAHE